MTTPINIHIDKNIICNTIISKIFLEQGVLSEYKNKYKLKDIFLKNNPDRQIVLNIEPSDTNYKLSSQFNFNTNEIIFNLHKKTVGNDSSKLEFHSKYIYDVNSNTINHSYRLDGMPSRIHKNLVNTTKFVKIKNPYYTINQLLLKIDRDDKPDLVLLASSLDAIKAASEYVKTFKTSELLKSLYLTEDDIKQLDEVFVDTKTKKDFDLTLKNKYTYYCRFISSNRKVYSPETLSQIPQNKNIYTTNNFYTNMLATRYGQYYEDIRNQLKNSQSYHQLDKDNITVNTYIDTINTKLLLPFTATDVFLFYFGKNETAMSRFDLNNVDKVIKLFKYMELIKSLMFTFISIYHSLYTTVLKFPTTIINLGIDFFDIYSSLSWSKHDKITRNIIKNIIIQVKLTMTDRKKLVEINIIDKSKTSLIYLDVIEIPYHDITLLSINTEQKTSQYKSELYKHKLIYTSLLDKTNIPFINIRNSIEGAIFIGEIFNFEFLRRLRKQYLETDDFSYTQDEEVYDKEYTVEEQQYKEVFPEISETACLLTDNEFSNSSKSILVDPEELDEEIEPVKTYLNPEISFAKISIKAIDHEMEEKKLVINSQYEKHMIKILQLKIENNKLFSELSIIDKKYNINKKELEEISIELTEFYQYGPDELSHFDDSYISELEEIQYEKERLNEKLRMERLEIRSKYLAIKSSIIYNETLLEKFIKENSLIKFTKNKYIIELEKREELSRYKESIHNYEYDEYEYDEDRIIDNMNTNIQELLDSNDTTVGLSEPIEHIKRVKDELIGGLKKIGKSISSTINKTNVNLIDELNFQYLDEANKELILRHETALHKIEKQRQSQIEAFELTEDRYQDDLMRLKNSIKDEHKLMSQLEEAYTQKVLLLHTQKESLYNIIEDTDKLPQLQLLEQEENKLTTEFLKLKQEKKNTWESKLLELKAAINRKKKQLNCLPQIHKNRYTIYKLTILIRNAERLYINEITLNKMSERLFKLKQDFDVAHTKTLESKQKLGMHSKIMEKISVRSAKYEKFVQEKIVLLEENITKIQATIKKYTSNIKSKELDFTKDIEKLRKSTEEIKQLVKSAKEEKKLLTNVL